MPTERRISEKQVPTSIGDARVVTYRPRRTEVALLLTHGAGGGIDARDLVSLADALPRHGLSVSLVEMPWRVQGKKLAPRPAVIDEAFRGVVAGLGLRAPLVIGGRSAGARSACRIGAEVGAVGVLALAFPLHPPGKPEKSRLDELQEAGLPTLVVQGERDPFGTPGEFPDAVDLVVVPAADHGLKVPKSGPLPQQEALALVAESTRQWVLREGLGNRRD